MEWSKMPFGLNKDSMTSIKVGDFYNLLHFEASSSAFSQGGMDRHIAEFKDDFEPPTVEKFLKGFEKHGIVPDNSTRWGIPVMYDMGWNQTDWSIRAGIALENDGIDVGRVSLNSPFARFIDCTGCDRRVYILQEETYTGWVEDDDDERDINYCHDCVPQDVYDAHVARCKRKGFAMPPPKDFA